MRANGVRMLANFADGKAPGHRVVDREDLLERVRQALPRDRARPARARAASCCARARARAPTSTGRASSSGRAPARSTPARPRCSATSSPSACSTCRRTADEVRALRRPGAAAQLDARLPRQASVRSRRAARVMEHEPRGYEPPQWRAARRDGLPRPRRARATPAARGSAPIELADRAARRSAASACPGRYLDARARGRRCSPRPAGRTRCSRDVVRGHASWSTIARARRAVRRQRGAQRRASTDGRVARHEVLRAVRRRRRRAAA